MSMIVMVAMGATSVAAPVLSSLAAAAAAQLGLRVLAKASERADLEAEKALEQVAGERVSLELGAAARATLEGALSERTVLHFGDGSLELTLERDIRGALSVRAHSETLGRRALEERARDFLGLVLQQLAYRAAVQRLRQEGFEVQEEQRQADGTARVLARRRGR